MSADTGVLAEILAAFDRADDPDGFMTKKELGRACGRSTRWVADRLHDLAEDGRLIVTKQRRPTLIPGQVSMVPVYKIKGE